MLQPPAMIPPGPARLHKHSVVRCRWSDLCRDEGAGRIPARGPSTPAGCQQLAGGRVRRWRTTPPVTRRVARIHPGGVTAPSRMESRPPPGQAPTNWTAPLLDSVTLTPRSSISRQRATNFMLVVSRSTIRSTSGWPATRATRDFARQSICRCPAATFAPDTARKNLAARCAHIRNSSTRTSDQSGAVHLTRRVFAGSVRKPLRPLRGRGQAKPPLSGGVARHWRAQPPANGSDPSRG